jgi:hypothetical protein
MNRVANFALRFAIRAAVHRRELNVLSCPCKRNWKRQVRRGKRRAISAGWPFEIRNVPECHASRR